MRLTRSPLSHSLLTCEGALGLVAVKNLTEEGFDVVGFEKNHWVGGLWHFTEEDKTSILKCKPRMPMGDNVCSSKANMRKATTINISKERVCELCVWLFPIVKLTLWDKRRAALQIFLSKTMSPVTPAAQMCSGI